MLYAVLWWGVTRSVTSGNYTKEGTVPGTVVPTRTGSRVDTQPSLPGIGTGVGGK